MSSEPCVWPEGQGQPWRPWRVRKGLNWDLHSLEPDWGHSLRGVGGLLGEDGPSAALYLKGETQVNPQESPVSRGRHSSRNPRPNWGDTGQAPETLV